MAAEYISYGGVNYYSGIAQGDPSNGQKRFDWNSKYFAYTLSGIGLTIRAVLNGNFEFHNGEITGTATSLTSFSYWSKPVTEEPYKIGASWNIKPEDSDYKNFNYWLGGGSRYIDDMASSVNYFYRSKENATITTNNSPFANTPYYTNRDSISNLLNSSLFPGNWWISPFEFQLPSTSKGTSNSSVSPKATLTATAAVDTLIGTAKKADTFDFSSSPNYNSTDRITNFSAKDKDKVQISSSSFGLSGTGTFKIAKNSKDLTKLLATDTQFIYNKADGGLYFNQNGTEAGYGTGGIFAVLEGKPTLGSSSVSVVA